MPSRTQPLAVTLESRELQATSAAAPWHALPTDEVLTAVASDRAIGLSEDAARRKLDELGPNALPEPAPRSRWAVVIDQIKSPLIYLLLLAAAIALVLDHVSDAIAIFAVVTLNAVIGAVQEQRAAQSLAALRKLGTHKARVLRAGVERIIETREVVPGDIVVLEAGDAVPADARLLDGAALQIAEAALTGESVPVTKAPQRLGAETPLADRRNMIYAGTHVTAGRARAVVVATGLNAEIGQIGTLAEGAEQLRTPLERRIAQFSRYIMVAAAVMFVMVNAIGLLYGLPFSEIFMLGISQLVGMIPEGLPVAMTIALAVGVQRMARRRAVVRQLSAVETLGSTTVICSDKTGTLTRNEMTVTAIYLPDGRELAVTGSGYEPTGTFLDDGRELDASQLADVRAVLEAAVLCNDAQLQGPGDSEPRWKPIGDPTEVALVTVAMKAGVIPDELRRRMPRGAELPFDSAAKLMATQHARPQGSVVIVKGAPEVVLELCRAVRQHGHDVELADDARRALHGAAERMAARALRVLAVGVVEGATLDDQARFAPLAGRVTLLGLLGQIDPPRAEVKDAVRLCRAAGIRPVMVTGDHKATGHAIARSLGIALDGDEAIDGRELELMSNQELADRIEGISVFARVHPAQKLRIVGAYQQRHEVVAMTGDGVNDAPALVKADVGIAMGLAGTEAAKEAAKIVIADDNFATIVAAVEEGRVVYRNIKKVLLLLFSTSAAEVAVLLLALIMGYPPPFAAVQILWNNLVSEGLITVNLIMEPAEGDEMRQRPIPHDEPLLTRILLTRMAFMAPAIVISTLGWFIVRTSAGVPAAQVQTETFTLLVLCEWFNVLNCRSESKSALDLGILKNHWLIGGLILGNLLQVAVVFWAPLGHVFHTVPFGLDVVIELGVVASLVLWVEELRKLFIRRRRRRRRLAATAVA